VTQLSIIIVSWNVRDLLRDCLASIAPWREALPLEVIVVDSASQDGSADMVQADFPWVRLMAQRDNVGFPRGNNIGLRAAQGQFLLLLNPDTVVVGDALPRMVQFLAAHPDVGMVGPHLLNSDGSYQSSRRRFPTVGLAALESTWLERLAPRRWLDWFHVREVGEERESADVDWITGAAMLTRHKVYAQVGGMDEGYVMYSEELDWCRRIRAIGWRIAWLRDARIVHHGGQSSEQVPTRTHILFNRAKLRYFRKYHGVWATRFLRLVLLANFAGQLLVEGAKYALGHRRDLRAQRLRSYWQVLRSGLPAAERV
jgi:GT2 family glycosyltransferase